MRLLKLTACRTVSVKQVTICTRKHGPLPIAAAIRPVPRVVCQQPTVSAFKLVPDVYSCHPADTPGHAQMCL